MSILSTIAVVAGSGVVIAAIVAAHRAYHDPGRALIRVFQEYAADAAARGLSPKEVRDERMMRIEMAKMRRLASARALADPVHGFEIMHAEIDAAVGRLAPYDKGMAWTFKKASKDWALPDCMYPDAVKAVMKATDYTLKISAFSPELYADMTAALRTPR